MCSFALCNNGADPLSVEDKTELTLPGTKILKESMHTNSVGNSGWHSKCSINSSSYIFLPVFSNFHQVYSHVTHVVIAKLE